MTPQHNIEDIYRFREDSPKWLVRKMSSKIKPSPYYIAFPVFTGKWRTLNPKWMPLFIFGVN